MATYVIRVWLPDRPGALGAVASRIGAVGGDVVAIDILERGAGRAIDELVVDFAEENLPQPGTDLGHGQLALGQEALGLQGDALVEQLLGRPTGRGQAGPGQRAHGAAELLGVLLHLTGVGEAFLDLGPEPGQDLTVGGRANGMGRAHLGGRVDRVTE